MDEFKINIMAHISKKGEFREIASDESMDI
jgi:hypothetical protein